jgi:hypothetical protein
MQLTKTLWVRRSGSNLQWPSACPDRPVAQIEPKSNWAGTIGILDLLLCELPNLPERSVELRHTQTF